MSPRGGGEESNEAFCRLYEIVCLIGPQTCIFLKPLHTSEPLSTWFTIHYRDPCHQTPYSPPLTQHPTQGITTDGGKTQMRYRAFFINYKSSFPRRTKLQDGRKKREKKTLTCACEWVERKEGAGGILMLGNKLFPCWKRATLLKSNTVSCRCRERGRRRSNRSTKR